MSGEGGGAAWEDDYDDDGGGHEGGGGGDEKTGEKSIGNVASREGKWESGKGRCAVTGQRVLGGTEGLRRVLV
jgi:peroxin-12